MLHRNRLVLSGFVALALGGASCLAQTFDNAAPDTYESPYIPRMIVSTRPDALVLRFEGDLQLGRRTDVVKRSAEGTFKEGAKYPIAVNQLVVTLNNEALEDLAFTVAPDEKGEMKVFPKNLGVSVKTDTGGAELMIPLKLVQFSPLDILAETDSIYYAKEAMVGTTGRNLFSAPGGGAVRVKIDSLPVKPDAPQAADLKAVKIVPALATLAWRTNNRTTAEVSLRAKGQAEERTLRQDHYAHDHLVAVPGLRPNTEYVALVTGTDFAGRAVKPASMTFQTPPLAAAEQRDAWLRVEGQYIVDSAGRPFPLGGYSQYVGEYWWNEFPRYGTMALTARYFRSQGFNVCRLGLVEHKTPHWSASIMDDGSAVQLYGGAEGFAKKFLRPLVDQVVQEGVYVILDWHWTYNLTDSDIAKWGDIWEACAKEFKDEPGVAMYQPMNEPCFADGQNRPDLAGRIRDITKDYIRRIRKHDKRHMILVSDWNCGWGWATEGQWAPVNFDPGDPERQIVYSKHISKEHTTDAFMVGGVDRVSDKWNVPIYFDEVEMGTFLPPRDMAWFFNFLSRNPRKYGFAIWVIGQYPVEQLGQFSAFAQSYLPRAPLSVCGENPIVGWWRFTNPAASTVNVRQSDNTEQKLWVYRYTLPKELPAGDYGLVAEGAEHGTSVEIAVVPADDRSKLMGTWLGPPGGVEWHFFATEAGNSAVDNAVYWHALKPFVEIVLRTNRELIRPCCNDDGKNRTELQLFRLNPKHMMPVPRKAGNLYLDLTGSSCRW